MATIKFELKGEHVKLLKHLRFSINKENILTGVSDDGDEIAPPFGENNIYEAIDLIINGKPNNFNPLEEEEIKQYSTEQKVEFDKLYSELPLALEIILFNGNFTLGTYKTKYNYREWKKLN